MKVLKYTQEQMTIFSQLADFALRGGGLNADPVVQQLKALLATAEEIAEEKKDG